MKFFHWILSLSLCASFALAQSSTATLNGTVTDETGAVIAGATVTLTQTATGQNRTTTTISNPFPNGFNRATNGVEGLLTQIGQSINAQVRTDRVPYSMQRHQDH